MALPTPVTTMLGADAWVRVSVVVAPPAKPAIVVLTDRICEAKVKVPAVTAAVPVTFADNDGDAPAEYVVLPTPTDDVVTV